jgi:hypothetical protein
MANNIDWEYLTAAEGYETKGYIPKDKKNKIIDSSGVTVGTGVDLGSKNAAYFAALPKTLRDKLTPYLGLKGTAAETALTNTPLSVTDAEARQINAVAKRAETDLLKEQWQSATGTSFDDLPQWMATPIASVLYQHGAGDPAKNIPKFWAAATSQDVPSMESELRKFGDKTPTRRKADADYLVGSLKDTTRQDLAKIIKKNAWQGTAAEDYINNEVGGITVPLPVPKVKPAPPSTTTVSGPVQKQIPTPPQFPPTASDLVGTMQDDTAKPERTTMDYLSDLASSIRQTFRLD